MITIIIMMTVKLGIQIYKLFLSVNICQYTFEKKLTTELLESDETDGLGECCWFLDIVGEFDDNLKLWSFPFTGDSVLAINVECELGEVGWLFCRCSSWWWPWPLRDPLCIFITCWLRWLLNRVRSHMRSMYGPAFWSRYNVIKPDCTSSSSFSYPLSRSPI